MDENELLLRHADKWSAERNRTFDSELVSLALSLRDTHDGLAANQWPAGSANHLMLVRWPAHGPVEPPDVETLTGSLDTFWGFLRSTGRMARASAPPAELRREAKRAAPKMAAACADENRFGSAKQLLGYGKEIGIDLDDVPDIDEANRRLQQIVEAWNAQPVDERLARSQGWLGGDEAEADDDLYDPTLLPDSPLFEFDQDGALLLPEALDLAASAAQARSSGIVRRMLALAEWVGDGKEITATDTLRPAVGRQAFADLHLEEWEREYLDRRFEPDAEQWANAYFDRTWRSAADCQALERLWRPALATGLITTLGRKAIFDPSAIPTTPDGWLRLGLLTTIPALAGWRQGGYGDQAIHLLSFIDVEHGEPSWPEDLAARWWDSAANTWPDRMESTLDDRRATSELDDEQLFRRISDEEVRGWLAMFADHGLWREQDGRLIGTELGRDALIVMVATISDTDPWAETND